MEFKKEFNEWQNKLSSVNMDFLEFVEKNPGCLDLANFKELELNDKLFTLQPWPTFISRETRETFREAGEGLFKLIKSITGRIFNFDPQKMSQFYGLPLNIIKLQMEGVTPGHIENLISRGDFIISRSGLKCIEYNVTPALGGREISFWESLYYKTPLIMKFLEEYHIKPTNENLFVLFLEHIVTSTLKVFAKELDELNAALIFKENIEEQGDPDSVNALNYFKEHYRNVLKGMAPQIGGDIFLCDFASLKHVNNRLFYKGKQIHTVVESNFGLVSPAVFSTFKSGNIALFNGPISNIFSNKLNMVLLSDYHTYNVYSEEEKRIIDAYVPWTRKMVPGPTYYKNEYVENLESFVRNNREKMVLKPPLGYGGDGISVGVKTSDTKWEEAVKTAIKEKHWLVQEMVEGNPGVYQTGEIGYDSHDMVWGLFVFGSRYCGAWVRVMPQDNNKGVVNCHQGATVSIIFDVEK